MICVNKIFHSVQTFSTKINLTSRSSQLVPTESLPSPAYKVETVENGKYEYWEKNNLFIGNNNSKEDTFSMVLPPPNITGKLHLGHALACTIQDVIARRKRAMGLNVLWQPGTDHAGIATQGVVEKHLKFSHNISLDDIGRDAFNKEVWKWKEKYGNDICQQLKTLGCSLDWSRQRFTMDVEHSNAVNIAFIKLFKKGLIYRKKALVNWCNSLQSTISDIEIENISITSPTERTVPGYKDPIKFGQLFTFAYKVVDSNEEILVATTMPETMLGDTAVAVHPCDNRYKHLIGKFVKHPFQGKHIPIISDEVVSIEFGTGAVKITPAHSKIDYDVSVRHNLELIEVIDEKGNIINSGQFNDSRKYECRIKIIKSLESLGLLRSIDAHEMTLPTCSRTGDVIEYLPKEQWFLSCTELNKKAIQSVENGNLCITPSKFKNIWYNWCKDDRDWCISRQLWWGHQIPAYKCSVDGNVIWIAAFNESEAKEEASKLLQVQPIRIVAERDTDVLDTWFSSGIYPFAALGWPESHSDYKQFYPLSLMVTGHDILGFWVHRMIILGLELTNNLPFYSVLLHGIVCDNKGAKMSKSKGNVIDPLDVIKGISLKELKLKTEEAYKNGILNKVEVKKALNYHKSNFSSTQGIPECGVDALRFTLLTYDIKSHYINFDVKICHANKLFCNKIWQSIKYMNLSCQKLLPIIEEVTINDLTSLDRWILSRLAVMVKNVNESMDKYDFHLATKSLKYFIHNEFCDFYLEATKPGFESKIKMTGYAHAHTLSIVLNTALRCLNPFMIYLTEELIPKIPCFEKNIIYNFQDKNKQYYEFPQYGDFTNWEDSQLENEIQIIIQAINLIRQLKGMYNINKIKPTIFIQTENDGLRQKFEENNNIITHLSKSCDLVFTNSSEKQFVGGVLNKDVRINVEISNDNLVDVISEAKQKICKKAKKMEDALKIIENKLASDHFITVTEPYTVECERQKVLNIKEELKNLHSLLN